MPESRSTGRGPQRRRLSRSAEFQRVYRQGRSHANRYLVLYAFPRAEGEPGSRLGVSVSRRVGGAVERNRVKRLLREAFWEEAERLPAESDYVVVARPDARGLGEREGMQGMRSALSDLIVKHGGRKVAAPAAEAHAEAEADASAAQAHEPASESPDDPPPGPGEEHHDPPPPGPSGEHDDAAAA